jgi:hypothetical protein
MLGNGTSTQYEIWTPCKSARILLPIFDLRAQNIRTNLSESPKRVLLAAEIEKSPPKNKTQLPLNSNNPRVSISYCFASLRTEKYFSEESTLLMTLQRLRQPNE